MPYLNLKLAADPSEALAEAAARALTETTAKLLGKRPDVTSVLVEFVPRTGSFVGGRAAEAGGFATFYLDAKITAGTNTKDEKAAWLRGTFRAIEAPLGAVHPASYVVLHELPADAWGYAGETQEYRYVKGKATQQFVEKRHPWRFSTRSPRRMSAARSEVERSRV